MLSPDGWLPMWIAGAILKVAVYLPIQAVEARSLPLVELLEREYAASLARDPQLPALLQAVKGAHFAVPQQGMGGMLGSLFSMLSAEEGQPA